MLLLNKVYNLNPKQYRDYFIMKNKEIIDIKICRKPIQKIIFNLLNVLSLNQFNENFKNSNYDDIFHLSLYITLNTGYKYILEKNQRVNFYPNMNYLNDINIQFIDVNLNNNKIYLKNLFENTINKIGKDNFWIYKSHSWNCQNFIYNILNCNGLMTEDYKNFIMQDTEKLFKNLGYLKILSDNLTNLGANLDIIYQGGNLQTKQSLGGGVIQSIIFNKKKYNIDDCKKWILDNNYKIKKIDETKKFYRFRQFNPYYLKKLGYNNYQTKILKPGLEIIIVSKI
jgi:hypothetical protein